MNKSKNVLMCILLYPFMAFALDSVQGRATLWNDLTDVNVLMSVLIALISANVAGVASTASKLKNPKRPVHNLWFAIFADQMGAGFAGLLMFAVTEHFDLGSFEEVALIMAAGYAGSALTESLKKPFINGLAGVLQRLFGGSLTADDKSTGEGA